MVERGPELESVDTQPRPARAALELRQVTKRYGHVVAVDAIDLSVESGTFLTVLGPSGSGKTTMLRMIGGFAAVTSGAILLDGTDVSQLTPGKRGIGMVFQQYALFPHMSVLDNVGYGLKVRRKPKAQRNARASEVLQLVGLEGYEDRYPRQLSGGQQQRVALARALAFEPKMLLMDEPLGALDRELRVRMAGELRRLHEQLNSTVVYVTHDREEALTLSDEIAVMREGRLEAIGSPQELYARPTTAFAATFFGGHNVVPCDVIGDSSEAGKVRVRFQGAGFDAHVSSQFHQDLGDPFLSLPGDAFELKENIDEADFAAVVHSAVYMGSQIQMYCDIEGPGSTNIRIRIDVPGGRIVPPPVGSRVFLSIDRFAATAVKDGSGKLEKDQGQ